VYVPQFDRAGIDVALYAEQQMHIRKTQQSGVSRTGLQKEKIMKRAIVTLVAVLALVGFIGLGGSMASTPGAWKAPRCTPGCANFIGAPGNCPMTGAAGFKTLANVTPRQFLSYGADATP
jgi:hypothetical protein